MLNYLACTRFTDETWEQNINYRNKNGDTVIYGSSVKIRESYNKGCLMFVAEMNNQHNRIEGIGLIRNTLVPTKCKIYGNPEYNRYIYKGSYWLGREQLLSIDEEVVEILDQILFKGKSNLKRFLGITVLTDKLFTNWAYDLNELFMKIKRCFINTYKTENNNIDNIDTNDINEL